MSPSHVLQKECCRRATHQNRIVVPRGVRPLVLFVRMLRLRMDEILSDINQYQIPSLGRSLLRLIELLKAASHGTYTMG